MSLVPTPAFYVIATRQLEKGDPYHRFATTLDGCVQVAPNLSTFDESSFLFRSSPTAFTKITRVNSTDYEVKLVDTAGQDEYSIFPAQYSMDFHGYVLVYSITSQKSFEVIQIIYEKLLDVMGKA